MVLTDTVVTAIIGFGGAILGSVVGGYAAMKSVEMKHQFTVVQARLDFRLKQLNEFYAPLYLYRRRSQGLRRRLPDYLPHDPTVRWRLVHNIEEARKNPEWAQVVDAIINVGDAIAERITNHAGLIAQSPPPESFQLFLQHHDRLKESWVAGKSQTESESWPFPGGVASESDFEQCLEGNIGQHINKDIDCAIWVGMQFVRRDAEALLSLKKPPSKELFDPILLTRVTPVSP